MKEKIKIVEYVKPYIFTQNINDRFKLITFHHYSSVKNWVGVTKYFPPISKEWKDSIYSYNFNITKNLLIYDIYINKFIKGYFNAFFNKKLLLKKFLQLRKSKYLSSNKIYVSQTEVKHTNSKAIITIYTYNLERLALLKKIRKLKKNFFNKIFRFFIKSKTFINPRFHLIGIKSIFYKKILLLRRYKLKFNLNKYKFEERFLSILTKMISKMYNKKIEFNIVKLKCIALSSDLFTRFATLKIRNIKLKGKRYKGKKTNPTRPLDFILHRVQLPKINKIKERTRIIKSVDFSLLENKFSNLHLSSMLKNSWNKALNMSYFHSYYNNNLSNTELNNIIFNRIKYKNISGVKLEVKGRLTTRYRADKTVFRMRRKGGLQNIDSSYKGLSSVIVRGYVKSNVEYSMYSSIRRIGAFAVKGWISGK